MPELQIGRHPERNPAERKSHGGLGKGIKDKGACFRQLEVIFEISPFLPQLGACASAGIALEKTN